jgi:hypothetical protein
MLELQGMELWWLPCISEWFKQQYFCCVPMSKMLQRILGVCYKGISLVMHTYLCYLGCVLLIYWMWCFIFPNDDTLLYLYVVSKLRFITHVVDIRYMAMFKMLQHFRNFYALCNYAWTNVVCNVIYTRTQTCCARRFPVAIIGCFISVHLSKSNNCVGDIFLKKVSRLIPSAALLNLVLMHCKIKSDFSWRS